MQPAHKTMHCDNSCEISRNNFPENDPEMRGISRLNVTFFNVDKANFSVLPIICTFSPGSRSLTRYPAISYFTIQRVQNSSRTFSIQFRYEILPQVQWRFKRTSFRGVLGMSQLESFRESNMQYPITHVSGSEKQDVSLQKEREKLRINFVEFIEFRFRVVWIFVSFSCN